MSPQPFTDSHLCDFEKKLQLLPHPRGARPLPCRRWGRVGRWAGVQRVIGMGHHRHVCSALHIAGMSDLAKGALSSLTFCGFRIRGVIQGQLGN